jgi:hypothetical protein
MLRKNMILMTALLASLALVGACKKTGAGGASGAAGAVTDILPKDTGFVVGFSVSKLKNTKLWETVSKKAMEDPEVKGGMDEMKTECGMDPMAVVDSVMISGSEDMNEDKMLVSLTGSFDEKKVNDCLTKMLKKKENKTVTITKDGAMSVYAVEGEEKKLYAAWLGSSQVVISADKTGAYLKDALAKKSSIKDNAMLSGLMKDVDWGALVHGAGIIPNTGEAAGAFGMMGGKKPDGAYANVHYTKDLDATIGLRFAADADAKATADQINKELEGQKGQPMVGDFLKGVKVSANGKDTVVKVALTEAQINQLISMAEMFMGGMGGGGGGMGGPPPGGEPPPPGGM